VRCPNSNLAARVHDGMLVAVQHMHIRLFVVLVVLG
jgi:hypothetical protein